MPVTLSEQTALKEFSHLQSNLHSNSFSPMYVCDIRHTGSVCGCDLPVEERGHEVSSQDFQEDHY